ncbi:MAG: DEAD/DEAH box helicase [Chloroflexota bacterium]|nr:DEAD/DEAH box helicase [Chloroflexota bacterium]
MTEAVVASVRLGPLVDRLYVSARDPSAQPAVARALALAMPDAELRSTAGGIAVAPGDVPRLLEVGGHGVELRWQPAARAFAENRARVARLRERVLDDVRTAVRGGKAEAQRRLAGHRGLEVLDDHQWVNVAAMTTPGGFGLCVFDEQGAGKTVTLIFAFDVLAARDEIDFALIVAPKSMVAEWPQDFRRFTGDLYKVVLLTGTRDQKRRALAARADVVVTNFETAVALEPELRARLGTHRGRSILVIDESFAIKNLGAARTRSLRRLREWAGRAFVLCGTPAPNTAHDIVQQVSLVDYGTTFDEIAVPEEPRAAQAVVQRALEERAPYVRHLKRDVLPDLPLKRFSRVMLELQPRQRRMYDGALDAFVKELRTIDDHSFLRQLPSFLARRSALLQICSNPRGVDPTYKETPAKLLALDELLEELVARRREKVVVWSFYTASLDAIVRRYARYDPVRYDGAVERVEDRREGVRRFQSDGPPLLFVGNPAAAGAGLTLHRARYAIYESMSNQGAHYLQSLDRIHRRGQTRDVEYIVLLASDTIEVNEYVTLTQKERAAQELLRDNVVPAPTRDTMLAEMLALAGGYIPDDETADLESDAAWTDEVEE